MVYCSVACKNEGLRIKGPGCRIKRTDGYVGVYYPAHPDATKFGWIMEHRLVMEDVLGRRILSTEQVHHINHIRDDNRPENLQVMSAADHTRVTLRDRRIKLAEDMAELALYRERFGPLL